MGESGRERELKRRARSLMHYSCCDMSAMCEIPTKFPSSKPATSVVRTHLSHIGAFPLPRMIIGSGVVDAAAKAFMPPKIACAFTPGFAWTWHNVNIFKLGHRIRYARTHVLNIHILQSR